MLFSWSIANFSLLSYNKSETLPNNLDINILAVITVNSNNCYQVYWCYLFLAGDWLGDRVFGG
jgi:hypothetical protein